MFKKAAVEPKVENGIVVGNVVDKKNTTNLLARVLIDRFNTELGLLVRQAAPKTILEVGCGEGRVSQLLLNSTEARIHATDISDTVLAMAKANVDSARITFENRSIYDLYGDQYHAELVICCEVMEHLFEPERGMERLHDLARPYCLLSVPQEPLWRALNMVRGAYLKQLGNTPGHVQHWSRRSFERFVNRHFSIVATVTPLPWTMLLCRAAR